ncbi:MAG: MBL fold metallo-hydrolase [Pseudomonadota bacterium]
MTATLQVLRPADHVFAFYDGRVPNRRLHGPQPNWLDDGGYTLGTCSYAIVDGTEALVYDTHMSLDHARRIRDVLQASGASNIRVVLSHHHLDHIAGNAVFADVSILANAATAEAMAQNRANAAADDPPIDPTVMPTEVFDIEHRLTVGSIEVALLSFDIHSHDGLVLWLPATRELFAGDTLEDTVTYVAEPERLEVHLPELDRLAKLPIDRILPNHGAPEIIDAGGYAPDLIGATREYVRKLLQSRSDEAWQAMALKEFIANQLASGSLNYHSAYEAVHQRNIAEVRCV